MSNTKSIESKPDMTATHRRSPVQRGVGTGRLSRRETIEVFADPVGYLRGQGIEAELVSRFSLTVAA